MSDSKIAALLAVKANSRPVLAAALVAANTELVALRAKHLDVVDMRLEVADLRAQIVSLEAAPVAPKTPAPKPFVRRDFAAETKARHARNRAMTDTYFAAFPQERSCTTYQLEQFIAKSAH